MAQLPDRVRGRRRAVVARERVVPFEPVQYAPPEREQDFLETLRRLWRHKWLILGCAIVLGGTATAVTLSLSSFYVAESRVQVGIQAPRYLNVEAIITDANPDQERVQNEGFVILSRDIAKQVIDRLKLVDNPEFNYELQPPSRWARYTDIGQFVPASWLAWFKGSDAKPEDKQPVIDAAAARESHMIDMVLSRIDVSVLSRSHVLSIKVESQNPQTAAAISNALADLYLEYQRQDKIKAAERVEKFLNTRIAELRAQVRKSDQAVEEYRKRYGLYKSGQSAGVTSQQLTELNSQLIAAQTAKAEAETRLREAQALRKGGMGGESVPEVLRSPLVAALKQQQADAERKAAELNAAYGPRHPLIINARSEIGNIQARVAAEVAKVIDGLAREAKTAEARYEALAANFEQLKGQMGNVNERAIELDALERDATVNRNLLEAMLNRAKQTIGLEEIQQANAKLVSPASAPSRPSYPPKPLLIFLGTIGGLLVGSAVALMREGADRTFRRSDQIVTATGLPVLAMVPQLGGGTPPQVHVLRKPTSPYSEALRRLHIGLELSETAESPKTILFTSATPGEGKSVMVASLGRLLASNGKRILLVDGDWRCPKLHQLFRCSNRNGLAGLLASETAAIDDFVHHDALSGVDLITAGEWTPQATHLLTSERMRIVLDALAPDYDHIILDTPPVLVGAEVLAFSRMVEKVVFVVRWGHTPREASLEGLKQIVEAQADVAGVVMSRVISKQYRQYSYGYANYEYSRPVMARIG
ncbi:polysaccharide biosynthesis tyrosine autokinase [Reyranella sp. CPCC 100927]|uniref:GumC family protein n=1 Tax=Reyranella sp. CPCC 100927 TaxID=2599616 RepID=UPI0011B5871E|nr:polysaccharide biosynthesis tyrosine autokinase [Reyranella sp. CPCC 100927]TWT12959.1 polysaccharide biosynthesis tyrosine autokinase [Reyranella sp. CPCC 100927]